MADVQETKSALWRRDEQLKRWRISETNRESGSPKQSDNVKVKFGKSYVFLAACSSGDKEEVKKLLAEGADINTANIDGLTALHQACIDDKLEMVRFLVEHKADINASDNEGWTSLHATASCGFLEVARYLIEKGADIAAVNNDGELAYDLAEGDDMEDLLQEEMDKQGIDADAARNEEENVMLRDANQWLSNGYDEMPHPKTGATALHCAAAKGYTKVMEVLLQAGADIDIQDLDGWTPLHAASHWGMEDSCKILVENLCNMEITNNSGQTAMDIVDSDIEHILKELKERQATLRKEERIKDLTQRGAIQPYKRRSSVTRMSVDQKQNVVRSNAEEERAILRNKVMEEEHKSSESSEADETADDESAETSSDSETEKKNEINRQTSLNSNSNRQVNGAPVAPVSVQPKEPEIVTKPETPTPKIEETEHMKPPPPKQSGPFSSGTASITTPRIQDLAKTERLQRDADKENERLTERSSNKNTALTDKLQTDISLRKENNANLRKEREERESEKKKEDKSGASENTKGRPISALSGDSLEAKNRSLVPPARDEEKEIERKAKAKRARESRRSTQGVTREDLELAEKELKAVHDKERDRLSSDDRSDKENKPDVSSTSSSLLRRHHTAAEDKTLSDDHTSHRRSYKDSSLTSDSSNITSSYGRSVRPSSSLTTNSISSTSSTASTTTSTSAVPSASTSTTVSSSTSTLTPYSSRTSYRSKYSRTPTDDSASTDTTASQDRKEDTAKSDDKNKPEQDKDESPSQKSSAIRARRKRDSRRNTGKVDVNDIQAAKEDETETKEKPKEETSRYNRFSDISGSSLYDTSSSSRFSSRDRDRPSSYHPGSSGGYSRSQSSTSLPDRDIDYKRLYEEQKAENEKLRKDVKRTQQELSDTKIDLEKLRMRSEPSRNSETAAERKEKRTLERKISELEEELRQMENLKQDNQRLKDENGALIRVISKLSK